MSGPLLTSFPPLARPAARVLVLGTMPGARSLAERQYYAHPQNAFWRIMGALFDFDPAAPYGDRVDALTGAGVAVWDVLGACRREGSLDTAIDPGTVVVNDFATLLREQSGLKRIVFNGAKAAELFDRHAAPRLVERAPPERPRLPERLRLPSTSPANARLRFDAKLAAWRPLREIARP